jgi:hypothetical protein
MVSMARSANNKPRRHNLYARHDLDGRTVVGLEMVEWTNQLRTTFGPLLAQRLKCQSE